MDSFENLMKVLDILPQGKKSELKQKNCVWLGRIFSTFMIPYLHDFFFFFF